MKRPFTHISSCLLLACLLNIPVFAKPASADSVIRIIGDKDAKSQNNSTGPQLAEASPAPVSGNTTIRIISDKPGADKTPGNDLATPSDKNPANSPVRGMRIVGDRKETIVKSEPEQSAAATTDEELLLKESAEQLLAKRLKALTEEEDRKAAEMLEQNRLSKVKAEQEKAAEEAARQAAIKREQEQLATRKAEEARREAEKAEQEQLAKIKAEQEKAAEEAARQAAIKLEQEQLATRKAEETRREAEKLEQERLAKVRAEQEKAKAELARLVILKKEQEQLATHKEEESLKAAEKAEQERVAAKETDDERIAAVRMAIHEKPVSELSAPDRQPDPAISPAGSQTESINSRAPDTIFDLFLAAKANDPVLGRAQSRASGSKAESDLLFSTLMPHVDSSAGLQRISQTLTNYNTPSDVKYDYNSFNYNITARTTLLNIQSIYALSASAAGLRIEQAGVAAARQNLIVKFTDSYFALLKAQTDKQIALGEINRLKQVFEQTQDFLKQGLGDLIAVYEAQARLDAAIADLTKSESTLRLAEQKLTSVVGKPVAAIVNYLPLHPTGPDPNNLDWWVETMERDQPVVRQAREGLIQAEKQRKAAKAEYLPVLQASGGYIVSRGTADLPAAEVRQWFVGASFSLPLYSGGETDAKVRRVAASEEERRYIFDETLEQQRENVKQAFYDLRYNISLIKALEQKMASAEIQLDAVKNGRNIGTRNAIDLLNAEQSYSIALRDIKYALYDNFIKVLRLKSAAGILTEEDVSMISKAAAPTLSSRLKYFPDINVN